jgi:predicted dehydrogenase
VYVFEFEWRGYWDVERVYVFGYDMDMMGCGMIWYDKMSYDIHMIRYEKGEKPQYATHRRQTRDAVASSPSSFVIPINPSIIYAHHDNPQFSETLLPMPLLLPPRKPGTLF